MPVSIEDQLALQDLTTRYARHLSRHEIPELVGLFTADAVYRAFGTDYSMQDFPLLLDAAPRGQLLVNPPLVDVEGDRGSGTQHYVFVDQRTHDMRLAGNGTIHGSLVVEKLEWEGNGSVSDGGPIGGGNQM